MDSSSFLPSRPGPRETTPRRPLTKAARRDVRRRLALAAEMKVFSVSIDGVVWTLFHPEMRAHKPSSPDDPAGGAAQGSSASTISRRSERSAKRLTDFRKARRNWLAILFRQWKQLRRPQLLAPPLQQPPPPPLPLLPLPQPSPTALATQQQPPQQQMDDERAPKRSVDASKAQGDSPSTPRAKRTLALGQPPPSIPPSPPSSHPSPPPLPEGSKPSKKISTSNGQGTRVGSQAPREEASRPPVVPANLSASDRPERVPVPRMCMHCERHVLSGHAAPLSDNMDVFVCDACMQDEEFAEGAHAEFGDTIREWKSSKYGYRCKQCDHVLPYLYDWEQEKCKRCA